MKVFAKENFREIRIKKGFSIVLLAEVVGMTKQAIGQIERRLNGVSPEKSQEILKTLGVEFDDVFELVDRGE
jgi:transcriptional regulator with XRE-family HTH domain